MKAYKVTVFIIDFDGLGADEIKDEMENVNYPNDCISVEVKDIQEAEIGEWHDEHPLNLLDKSEDEYRRLFP